MSQWGSLSDACHPLQVGLVPCPRHVMDLQGVLHAGAHARVLPCLTGAGATLLRYHASRLRAFSQPKEG